jgi:plasmid replication initiation protein
MPEGQDEKNIFIETLEWICNKLDLANIPYMITGGSALGFWGHIRTTMDIDIVIQINKETIDSFLKSIENEAYVDFQKAKEAVFKRRMFNIIFNKTCFKIDLISLKEDV